MFVGLQLSLNLLTVTLQGDKIGTGCAVEVERLLDEFKGVFHHLSVAQKSYFSFSGDTLQLCEYTWQATQGNYR